MNLIQVGIPKSGNFWIYNLLQQILDQGKIEQRSYIKQHPVYPVAQDWELGVPGQVDIDILSIERLANFCLIWPIFREPIDDLDAYIDQTNHVWTHSPFTPNSLTVLPKFDKIIYIIRDPRDVAISMSQYVFSPFIKRHFPVVLPNPEAYLDYHLERLVKDWIQHVGGYLKHQAELDFHIIFYERLLHNFNAELSDLLAYLEIDVPVEANETIKTTVDFSRMQAKNPHHLRKGKSGGWKDVLTPVQVKRIATLANPLLAMLNYPLHQDGVLANPRRDDLPSVPDPSTV